MALLTFTIILNVVSKYVCEIYWYTHEALGQTLTVCIEMKIAKMLHTVHLKVSSMLLPPSLPP